MKRAIKNVNAKEMMNSHCTVSLGPYTKDCLDKSWVWLKNPEIKSLTMTPDFTREEQLEFFEQLPYRSDYLIWSVVFDGQLIGAAGLKNYRGTLAEYWGYLGEKQYWNRGLGSSLIRAVEVNAKARGFSALDLKVSPDNLRAIALYKKDGFLLDPETQTESCLRMVKRCIS